MLLTPTACGWLSPSYHRQGGRAEDGDLDILKILDQAGEKDDWDDAQDTIFLHGREERDPIKVRAVATAGDPMWASSDREMQWPARKLGAEGRSAQGREERADGTSGMLRGVAAAGT